MGNILISVESITVPANRLRAVTPSAVNALAESMRQIKLRNPICVRVDVREDEEFSAPSASLILVSGATRLAAAKSLGWSEIECTYFDGSALDAELWEIDENLCRAELTPAEMARHLARREVLWGEREKVGGKSLPTQVDATGRKKSPQQQKEFAADTATKTGVSKRSTNQHLARAKALGEDIESVVRTSLDSGVELDALAKLAPEQRKEIIQKAKAGEDVSARPTERKQSRREMVGALMKGMDEDEWVATLVDLWESAPDGRKEIVLNLFVI